MPIGEYSEAELSWSWINERIWDRRNNLQGLDLDAYVLDNKPDSMVGRTRELIPPDPEKVMVEEAWGAFPETGRLLGEKLNFTLSLYQRKDERWGIASR